MERFLVRLPFQITEKPRNLNELLEATAKAGAELGKQGREIDSVSITIAPGGQPEIIILYE